MITFSTEMKFLVKEKEKGKKRELIYTGIINKLELYGAKFST